MGELRQHDASNDTSAAVDALSAISTQLIRTTAWTEAIPDLLEVLGSTLCAHRVCLLENYRRADGRLIAKSLGKWCSPDLEAASADDGCNEFTYGDLALPFGEDLQVHMIAQGRSCDFPEPSRRALELASVCFVVAAANKTAGTWWGSFLVQYCTEDHEWSDVDRKVLEAVCEMLDAALSHRAPEPMAESYRELVEEIPAILYIDDPARQYRSLYVGPQIETILGISQATWLNEDDAWQRNMHHDDWASTTRQYEEFISRRAATTLVQEYRMIRPDDGRVVWIRDECKAVPPTADSPGIVKGVMYDVTEQKGLEDQLRSAQVKRRALIEQIPGIVYVQPLSDSTEEPFVSSAVEKILGCTREQWLYSDWWLDHLHEMDRDRVTAAQRAAEEGGELIETEYRMRLDDERIIWINETSRALFRDGNPWVLQGVLADTTKRKEAEEQMEFLAFHDVLTGLPNRAMFNEHLVMALSRAVRNNRAVAVLYVDLDDMKQTNDSHGHRAGDELLQATAARLRSVVRKEDLVARFGGDEFLITVPDLERRARPPVRTANGTFASPAAALAIGIAERICAAMSMPVQTSGGLVHPAASIGISLFPDDADDAIALVQHADTAMYASKQTGRGTFGVYAKNPQS
jgi:diguanylate cyclase (GGDEF)-like protein/PAS domain S-box-containing protein